MSDTPEPTQSTLLSPGQQLKAARLEAGLSLEDTAKALFLTRHKLIALEEDDYSKLTSPVFVHGYIRKYAALLNLDGEALVADFNRLNPPPAEPEQLQLRSLPAKKGSQSWLPLSGVAIAVAIAVTVAINSNDNDVPQTSIAQRDVDQTQERTEQSSLNRSSEAEESARTVEPVDTAAAQSAERVDNAGIAENSAARENSVGTQRNETTANLGNAEVTENQSPAPSSAIADNAPASTDNVAARAESPPRFNETTSPALANNLRNRTEESGRPSAADQLAFAFLEECWLEVADANGDVIHTSIAKAGDTLALAGEAPFSIKLGNARAVSLSLNGNNVEIEPRPGSRTHRLVVGE